MRMFGLIGKPLSHSFSKTYFTNKFKEEQLNYCYENFELPSIDMLISLIAESSELQGLNVTIPYKEEVLPSLFWQNDVVQKVGACNCINITGGKLYGYNTDVIGFKNSVSKYLKPYHKKALILGTGGAAKAVAYALKLLAIEYKYVSRKSNTAALAYDDLNKTILEEYLVIINTTPLGMYPQVETAPDLPFQLINKNHLLFDLTYNPEKTLFLKRGEERRAAIANGYEMLVIQAEESWKIWNA